MTPYETLGVAPTASDAEIKSAYRRLARKLHPDLNPNDAQAEERFKDVSSAYRIVGDAQARKRYDAGEIDSAGNEQPQQRYYRDYADSDDAHQYANQGGFAGFDGFEDAAGGGFDQNDIFAELLRRQRAQQANRRGQDVHYRLGLSLAEAINGGTRRIDLAGGGTLDITIPKNVVAGQTLRLKAKGAAGTGTGTAGDALIELDVLPDARFQAQGADLVHELPISLREAVLGGKVRVPTPTGQAEVTIAPMSSSGTTLRLKGMGAPLRGGRRGDELVRLKIVLPKTPDPELTRFVEGWANGEASNPREETRT